MLGAHLKHIKSIDFVTKHYSQNHFLSFKTMDKGSARGTCAYLSWNSIMVRELTQEVGNLVSGPSFSTQIDSNPFLSHSGECPNLRT